MLKFDNDSPMTNISSYNHIYLGMWLSIIFVMSFIANLIERAVEITLFVALVWPISLYFINSKFRNSLYNLLSNKQLISMLYIFFLSVLLSLFNSYNIFNSSMYALALIVSMTLCYSFAFIYSEYQFKNGLIIYSLFGSITLLVYQSFAHVGDSGRLEGVLNSNSIGLISLSIILAAQLSNRIYMVLLLSLPSTYVLYLTNSRSAIVGLVIGLGVYYLPRIKMINYIVALILLLIIFLTVSYEQIGDVFSYNINKILALDDPYRGIGSGATNRAFAWAETWDLFVQHPFTGVGFRAHEDLLTTESSSHNGYLSILAEVGIIGSFATAYLIIHSIYRYCKSYRRDILSRFWLALIMSYLFVAVFERFLFNTGNPTSLLFQLALVNSFICQNRNLDAVI